MPRAMAAEFYAEHAGRPFYEPLLTYMTSSEVLALQLEREAATSAWRALLGPTDSANARTTAPGVLHACILLVHVLAAECALVVHSVRACACCTSASLLCTSDVLA
jgi:Nucleoside diphosphate kinase